MSGVPVHHVLESRNVTHFRVPFAGTSATTSGAGAGAAAAAGMPPPNLMLGSQRRGYAEVVANSATGTAVAAPSFRPATAPQLSTTNSSAGTIPPPQQSHHHQHHHQHHHHHSQPQPQPQPHSQQQASKQPSQPQQPTVPSTAAHHPTPVSQQSSERSVATTTTATRTEEGLVSPTARTVKSAGPPDSPTRSRARIEARKQVRDQERKRLERAWATLFTAMRQSIDQVYCTCELEGNLEMVQEATRLIATAQHDFHKLVERLSSQQQAERHGSPKSMAWEVRKTSPAKLGSILEVTPSKPSHQAATISSANKAASSTFAGPNLMDKKKKKKPVHAPSSAGASSSSATAASATATATGTAATSDPLVLEPLDSERSTIPEQQTSSGAASSEFAAHGADASSAPTAAATAAMLRNKKTKSTSDLGVDVGHSDSDQDDRDGDGDGDNDGDDQRSTHSQESSETDGPVSPLPDRKAILKLQERLSVSARKTPEEAKKRRVEKEERAKDLREAREQKRTQAAEQRALKMKDVLDRKTARVESIQNSIRDKMITAENNYEAHLAQKKAKASAEVQKVEEAAWIAKVNAENMKLSLQQKQDESEQRRNRALEEIRTKQMVEALKDSVASERRRLRDLEREKLSHSNDFSSSGGAGGAGGGGSMLGSSAGSHTTISPLRKSTEFQRRKMCTLCQLEFLEEFTETHLKGRAHMDMLAAKGMSESEGKAHVVAVPVKSIMDSPTGPMIKDSAGGSGSVVAGSGGALGASFDGSSGAAAAGSTNGGAGGAGDDGSSGAAVVDDAALQALRLREERIERNKKKSKKLKLRMAQRVNEYEDPARLDQSATNVNKIQKLLRTLQADLSGSSRKVGQAERLVGDIGRMIETKGPDRDSDIMLMRQLGGIRNLVTLCSHYETLYPPSSVALALRVLGVLCQNPQNRDYMLLNNQMVPLVNLLLQVLCVDAESPCRHDVVLAPLLQLLTAQLRSPAQTRDVLAKDDFLGYIAYTMVFERIRERFSKMYYKQGSVLEPKDIAIAGKCIQFAEAFTLLPELHLREKPVYKPSKIALNTAVLEIVAIEADFVGTLELILHLLDDADHSNALATVEEIYLPTVRLLNNLALLDLKVLQHTLGTTFKTEFFHIVSKLFHVCGSNLSQKLFSELLHELLLLLGYFVYQSESNSHIMQWKFFQHDKTLLQTILFFLPFNYFADPRLKEYLFPTVIAACHKSEINLEILKGELSLELILIYIEEKRMTPTLQSASTPSMASVGANLVIPVSPDVSRTTESDSGAAAGSSASASVASAAAGASGGTGGSGGGGGGSAAGGAGAGGAAGAVSSSEVPVKFSYFNRISPAVADEAYSFFKSKAPGAGGASSSAAASPVLPSLSGPGGAGADPASP